MNHHSSDLTPAPSRRASRPFAPLHSSERGAALIIVLAFVVMLLVLLLAFFSKSTQQQQISKSSSTIDLTDIFAQGAVSTIVANLKQEIVDGSTPTNITTTNALTGLVVTNTVYYPTTNTNGVFTTAVPQLVGCTTNTTNANNPSGQLPNLVKISTNLPFYALTNSNGSTTNGVNIATTNSTTNASYNGRSISAARWNEPLLLPATSVNNYTPSNGTGFVPPSWILVARNGSNPTNWSSSTGTDMRWNTTNPTTVIGRYAYAIYNEGGLLDANVAGFPPALTNPPTTFPTNLYPAYKEGAYFADLTQIGMTTAQITALVGWRNYASSGLTNTFFPNYTILSAKGGSNYSVAVLGNTNGFLQVATNTVPSGSQTLTDRQFTSRQQLIAFLINADTNGVPNALSALQSLGTFSRSLEQPSYQPAANRPIVYSTVGSNAPATNDFAAQGGNNAAYLDDQINPSFLTLRVTNSFLRTNATTVTTTNAAIVGEPLIKQRFALNRLAWITYKGPSAKLFTVGTNTTDPVMLYYMSNGISASLLTNGTAANIATYFGLTWSNAATPLGGCWYYNVHNGSVNGVANVAGVNNQGSINRLSAVAALPYPQGREPDFFELLKATQVVGSIAKGSIAGATAAGTGAGSGYIPLNWQYKLDTSVDYAVIQLGANIIDQFDPDSFPTRIRFDDGSGATNNTGSHAPYLREFRGVEDLPYLYRIHCGTWIGRDSNPSFDGTNNTTTPPEIATYENAFVHSSSVTQGGQQANAYYAGSLRDPGVGILLGLPDVWNPHSPSIPRIFNSALPIQPTLLRVTAASLAPDDILNNTTNSPGGISVGGFAYSAGGGGMGFYPANLQPATLTDVSNATSFTSVSFAALTATVNPPGPNFQGGYAPHNKVITTNTSYVQFTYGTNLYREPTMLAEYGKAAGAAMFSGIPGVSQGEPDLINLTNVGGTKLLQNGYLSGGSKSLGGGQNSLNKPNGDSGQYVGIFIGIYPLRWVGPRSSGMPQTANPGIVTGEVYSAYLLNLTNTGVVPTPALTYLLQYQDPNNKNNWITYDEKYGDITATVWAQPVGMLQTPNVPSSLAYVDPRTSRFGAPEIGGGGLYGLPGTMPDVMSYRGVNPAWLDPVNNVMWSDRPDYYNGTAYNFRNGSKTNANGVGGGGGWSLFAAPGWHLTGLGGGVFYANGPLSQNNPYFPNSGTYFTNVSPQTPSTVRQDPVFYGDPDGVVRRAMGGYFTNTAGIGGSAPSLGLPMAVANSISGGAATPLPQAASRPVMLNRPFRSVAELGYVFSGRPWRNIDFFTPESGESPFLDVFCINPPVTATGLSAGKVNLNTRQTNVLAALISGGYRDETNPVNANSSFSSTINSNDATSMAAQIIAYTATNPLGNMADLVGRWKAAKQITNTSTVQFNTPLYTTPSVVGNVLFPYVDGSSSYVGISALFTNNSNFTNSQIQRFREAPIRALSAAGQTRVWNLLIDVVAQTGKYPQGATGVDNFTVDGETRYWVHLAIDRLTGQVLDEQIEAVKD